MFVIVGLGNPGPEYEATRHNLGFLVVDLFAKKCGVELSRSDFKAVWGEGKIEGKQFVVAKPLTFVNRSGEAVGALVEFFGASLDQLLVVHDDLDLPFGDVRVKAGGGSAGHNGLKSVIGKLAEDGFIRIRIGIGRPPEKQDPADFVLTSFSDKEQEEIRISIVEAVDVVASVLTEGVSEAMRKFNTSTG